MFASSNKVLAEATPSPMQDQNKFIMLPMKSLLRGVVLKASLGFLTGDVVISSTESVGSFSLIGCADNGVRNEHSGINVKSHGFVASKATSCNQIDTKTSRAPTTKFPTGKREARYVC